MMAQPGFGQQHFGVVHPIATNTFPVSHREDSPPQQPEEEDLTSELGPSEPVVLVEQVNGNLRLEKIKNTIT